MGENTADNQNAEPNETQPPLIQPEDVDKNKVLEELRELKKQNDALKAAAKNREVEELKRLNDWQKIAELKEKEAKDFEQRYSVLRDSLVTEKKLSVLKEEAIKAGMRVEACEDLFLLDFPELSIENNNMGRITVHGADRAVMRLKATRPHWFGSRAATVNGASPDVISAGKVTYEQVEKAKKDAEKSGDYTEAKRLVMLYKSQNQ